jgi:hypothetical protein
MHHPPPPWVPLHSYHSFIPSLSADACFGWLLHGNISNDGRLRPRCNFIFLCFQRSVWRQIQRGLAPPHRFCPGLASSSIYPPPRTPTSIWLLYVFIEWRPPKANAPPISLFFYVASKFIPNKGTSRRVRRPSAGRLQKTHRERRRNDLRCRCSIHGETAKLLDRVAVAAHVDCCVLCVCLWLCLVVFCVWEQL